MYLIMPYIFQTGTGKTLAFLLPAFIHIEGQPMYVALFIIILFSLHKKSIVSSKNSKILKS